MPVKIKADKLTLTGIILLAIILAAAVLVPFLSPYSYSEQHAELQNSGSSLAHLFGTDKFGRDIFVRIWYGVRISLLIGFGSAFINGVIGVIYGGIAGSAGGRIEVVLMQIADVIASIPSLLYVILITLTVGANVGSILAGICVSGWVATARLVRGEMLRLKELDYVQAVRLAGGKGWYIFFRHLLPGAAGAIIVNLTFLIPQAIFTEAFLSFVGVGIAAPAASLGTLIQDAVSQLQLYPAQMLYPCLILCLLILAVNLIGTGLEDQNRLQKEGQW